MQDPGPIGHNTASRDPEEVEEREELWNQHDAQSVEFEVSGDLVVYSPSVAKYGFGNDEGEDAWMRAGNPYPNEP